MVFAVCSYNVRVCIHPFPNFPLFPTSVLDSFQLSLLFLSLSCRYQLLHINIQSSLFVTETPERVGTLLDYQLGRLSFYNAQSGQLLGTFCQQFTQPCHPALALEMLGSLEVSMVLKMPDFIKNS